MTEPEEVEVLGPDDPTLTDDDIEDDDDYDWESDRVCSYPCSICGEEDDYDEEDLDLDS